MRPQGLGALFSYHEQGGSFVGAESCEPNLYKLSKFLKTNWFPINYEPINIRYFGSVVIAKEIVNREENALITNNYYWPLELYIGIL